jgi:aminoglycoside phosphotransferase (APT) family kinase protein
VLTASRGLPAAALHRVCDELAAGGEIVRVRPVRGGISSSVHLVRMRNGDGVKRAVVVRRYGEYSQRVDPAACAREYRLLTALAKTDFPAPRPLILDAEGGPFGAPTVVMTRVPGRPECAPRDLSDYLQQMAQTLADLHNLSTQGLDFLSNQRDMVNRTLGSPKETDDPLQRAVWEAARAAWPLASQSQQRVLVHGDYWPGNILWRRGRLVGLVDWEQPRLGEPTKDVATCRGDLWVLFGRAAADEFLDRYVAAGGQPVNELRFWELLISTWAVPEMPDWAVAYRVLGRPDLTADVATPRIREFAQAALSR